MPSSTRGITYFFVNFPIGLRLEERLRHSGSPDQGPFGVPESRGLIPWVDLSGGRGNQGRHSRAHRRGVHGKAAPQENLLRDRHEQQWHFGVQRISAPAEACRRYLQPVSALLASLAHFYCTLMRAFFCFQMRPVAFPFCVGSLLASSMPMILPLR